MTTGGKVWIEFPKKAWEEGDIRERLEGAGFHFPARPEWEKPRIGRNKVEMLMQHKNFPEAWDHAAGQVVNDLNENHYVVHVYDMWGEQLGRLHVPFKD